MKLSAIAEIGLPELAARHADVTAAQYRRWMRTPTSAQEQMIRVGKPWACAAHTFDRNRPQVFLREAKQSASGLLDALASSEVQLLRNLATTVSELRPTSVLHTELLSTLPALTAAFCAESKSALAAACRTAIAAAFPPDPAQHQGSLVSLFPAPQTVTRNVNIFINFVPSVTDAQPGSGRLPERGGVSEDSAAR